MKNLFNNLFKKKVKNKVIYSSKESQVTLTNTSNLINLEIEKAIIENLQNRIDNLSEVPKANFPFRRFNSEMYKKQLSSIVSKACEVANLNIIKQCCKKFGSFDISIIRDEKNNNIMFMLMLSKADNQKKKECMEFLLTELKELIKAGFVDINEIDDNGNSLLHIAATTGNYEMLKILDSIEIIDREITNSENKIYLDLIQDSKYVQQLYKDKILVAR